MPDHSPGARCPSRGAGEPSARSPLDGRARCRYPVVGPQTENFLGSRSRRTSSISPWRTLGTKRLTTPRPDPTPEVVLAVGAAKAPIDGSPHHSEQNQYVGSIGGEDLPHRRLAPPPDPCSPFALPRLVARRDSGVAAGVSPAPRRVRAMAPTLVTRRARRAGGAKRPGSAECSDMTGDPPCRQGAIGLQQDPRAVS
jgi:hypothetical protein